MDEGRWLTWRAAMQAALYGPGGFYCSAGAPGRHFRTAAHTGAAWADAIRRLVSQVDDEMDRPDGFTVVEIGAGHGELLTALAARAPERWRLVGVDVAPAPAALPGRVEWPGQPPDSFEGVLVAFEWLDVVPVDVVEMTEDGPRLVEVAADGEERLGASAPALDRDWLDRWWPLAEAGDRGEVGRPRDEAWARAVARLRRGVAVAVDYGAVPARDVAGTLTGFRAGRQVAPMPDASMDLTAHVLFDSLVAGTPVELDTVMASQREVLRSLGVRGRRPSYDGNPGDYLATLSRAGDEAELIDAGGLGAFTWLVQAVGTRNPLRAIAAVEGSPP